MTEPRKRDSKPKNVIYLNTFLACQRCDRKWQVVDLNTERKTQICPVCGEPNDTKEAIKRAA